ncbi:MAG: 2-oxoacid:ferredoxin oxidoreductase subunit beta [Pseudolabrys sp.]|nr:2-oxoacid:ferredoxin oxidoreductase subunit beta [Pseudolabrys sp.]
MNLAVAEAQGCALKAKDFSSGAHPIWCPGCGDFGVLAALERALALLGRPPHEVVLVSGIGCSSRLPGYMNCYGFHGVHGRALATATGLKLARPDLEVIALGGDGDGFSIGGNHFIHTCRRNVDMLYIVMDNRVYGMTKGQPSPTTESDWDSELIPGGSRLPPFNPVAMAVTAGATFVARGYSGDPQGLAELIVAGSKWPGFAFVEVLSPCVTFRPEEFEWKRKVRHDGVLVENDRGAAVSAALSDDGFSLGILFRGKGPRVDHQPPTTTLAAIEEQFLLPSPDMA